MRGLSILAAAVAGLIGSTLAAPLIVHPGTAKDLVITSQDTVNGSYVPLNETGTGPPSAPKPRPAANANVPFNFYNNFGSGGVNAYITGADSNGNAVFVQSDGSFYYPSSGGSSTPVSVPSSSITIPLGGQGSTTTVTTPGYISSGRIWFAVGELQFFVVSTGSGEAIVEPSQVNPSDPSADVNWGFVELTNNDSGIYVNISYVDFVGLPLGIKLEGSAGSQSALGVQANAVSSICSALDSQANSDGQPWNELCVTDSNGNPLRVLSPQDYISVQNSAFSDYYTDYVNQVWSYYSSNTLTINTQESYGDVACTVSGSTLNCAGDNQGYSQPAATDIFSCNSGPFALDGQNGIHYAVVPRLCAAFDRSTLLLNGGNTQPGLSDSSYYTVSPTNYYSKIVHQYEVDGKGYAFSYDDVNPSGENESGLLSDGNPSSLTVIVGGPTS